MKNIFKIGGLLFAGLLSNACSTSSTGLRLFDDRVEVEHIILANHFVFPESQGRFLAGNMKMGFAGSDSVRLVDDIDNVNITTPNTLAHGGVPSFNMALGIISFLDYYYAGGSGLKLQVLGKSKKEAKKGDFSLAIASNSLNSVPKTTSEDLTGSVKNAEATLDQSGQRHAIIFGYRTSEKSLFYGGPFYTTTKVNSLSIYQTNNSDFTFRGDVASGESKILGINMGIYGMTPKALFKTLDTGMGLEASYTQAEWTNTFNGANESTKYEGVHVGAVISLGW